MGSSLTEEELIQMVRDFIELSESSTSPISVSSSSDSLSINHQPECVTLLKEMTWSATSSEVEILEKILMYVKSLGRVMETNKLKKWVVMRLKMDGYEASLCTTSWVVSSFSCPKVGGCYEYIDVIMMDENGDKSERLIVDIDFRSQFELARPTSTYKELTNTLPCIYVGSEEKLENIISLLCSAAKQSLKENGLHIPPWRKVSYMQSKWLSKHCKKVSISPNMEFGFVDRNDGVKMHQ